MLAMATEDAIQPVANTNNTQVSNTATSPESAFVHPLKAASTTLDSTESAANAASEITTAPIVAEAAPAVESATVIVEAAPVVENTAAAADTTATTAVTTTAPETTPATQPTTPTEAQEVVVQQQESATNDTKSTSDSEVSPALLKEQMKHCTNVLRSLKRHSQAPPFLAPVDPVALNIPEYFNVVKNPMDLSTIASRMEQQKYTKPAEFEADVRLMLNNCFLFNHPDSVVFKMGKALEKYFNGAWARLPQTLTPPSTSARATSIGTPMAPSRSKRVSQAPRRLSNTMTAAAYTPSAPRARSRSTNPEMSFCSGVLRELMKKTHHAITWPFLEPVDPIRLGIPDYFDVIKTPMDLSTVRQKLDAHRYQTADEFEADVRLIFANCYAYNAPDSDVVALCRAFEDLFNQRWAAKPATFAASTSHSAGHHHHGGGGSSMHSSGSLDDFDSDSEKILEINRKMQELQNQLNHLLMKRKHRANSSTGGMSSSSRPPAPKKASSSSANRARSAAASQQSMTMAPISEAEFLARPMTFEEKRKLSEEVNELSPERLGRVVEIIQAGMDLEAEGESDTIELDIESLGVKTLRQLQRYVAECKGITDLAVILGDHQQASAAKRKKPAAPAPRFNEPAASSSSSSNPALAASQSATTHSASSQSQRHAPLSSDDGSSDEDL